MDVNQDDYLEEVKHCMNAKDMVKTEILLEHLDLVDSKTQKKLIFELSKADDDFSLLVLKKLILKKENIIIAVPAIEQVFISKFMGDSNKLIAFLNDEDLIKQRNLFIKIAAEIQSEDAIPALIEIANNATNDDEVVLLLKAFGDIGSPDAVNLITEHLYSNNRKIIITAIKALRKLATPYAIKRLADRMGTDQQLDLLIVDTFATIQDKVSLEKLNETLVAHSAFIRNYGKSKLVKIGAKVIPQLIENLLYDDPDLLIHTLNVLAEIGDKSAIAPIRKLLFNEPKDGNIRFAAYEALGLLPLDKSAYLLAEGLSDEVDNVRLAAAKAINKNYNKMLSIGISNLLSGDEKEVKDIIIAVIDSESDTIFVDKIEDEDFMKVAIKYLKDEVPDDLQKHFTDLLKKNGYNSIATEIESSKKIDAGGSKIIFVVDDSRMILGIYRTTLHRLGYESVLFEFPADAIEKLKTEKPDLLITDLNMPEITGVGLTEAARKIYSKKELPIVMCTTQNEVQDNDDAYSAGVDLIIHKPFTDESIKTAIDQFKI